MYKYYIERLKDKDTRIPAISLTVILGSGVAMLLTFAVIALKIYLTK